MASESLSHLSNPLATPEQLLFLSPDLQKSIFKSALLTQAAGVLLELSQGTIAHAAVLGSRYLISCSGGENEDVGSKRMDEWQLSPAVVYLAAKLSQTPLSSRSLLLIYTYLLRNPPSPIWPKPTTIDEPAVLLPESSYQIRKDELYEDEKTVLQTIGFQTSFSNPMLLALTYLSTIFTPSGGDNEKIVARKVVELLNDGLLSPQVLYLTHQPNVLACAAIYLAAREVEVKLPEVGGDANGDEGVEAAEGGWWQVFDVSREELGFVVLGLRSLGGWVEDVMKEEVESRHNY
ncbi:MAG: hypothetical protein M1834_009130 [Cirrosporium novae-zelandiae]|nr:MAG: hypothetical protein M1834_009130 [Cirrosporium novae-zelandiae]